jgi:hypothetical protein
MFDMIKKLTLAASASALAFAAAAATPDMPRASDIDVTASYDAAEGSNAEALFPGIGEDVRLAIAELVPQSGDGADPIIRVDIRKIALNGDTILPESREFNELEGVVSIETESGKGGQAFNVNVTAARADGIAPEGYILLPPSTGDFYQAMVDGFARNVADRFASVNTEGASINR